MQKDLTIQTRCDRMIQSAIIFYTQFYLYLGVFAGIGYFLVLATVFRWFNLPTLMFMANTWGFTGYMVANVVVAGFMIDIFDWSEAKKLSNKR